MKYEKRTRRNERGISVIFTAISLVTLVPLVGLAIDAGILYTVKGKLQTAVDAAALAAGEALSRGNDDTTQQTSATAVAEAYALMNFPTGYFSINAPAFPPSTVTIDESVANQRSITVTASVSAPLYFLRWLGDSATTVVATATAVRRDVNVSFVMDRSNSLNLSGSCAPLVASAVSFVGRFANGRDNIGLVTFATSANIDFPIANNFNTATPSVPTILNSLICSGGTNSSQGLSLGYQQLSNLNQPNALNVVLFFTDGYPNSMTGNWPISSSSSCTSKTNKVGVIAPGYANYQTAPTTPAVEYGLWSWIGTTQPMSSDQAMAPNPPTDSTGCAYVSDNTQVYNDVPYIPTTDIYGNSTNTGYQSVTMSGANIAMTSDGLNVQNASWNAADSAGLHIRNGDTMSAFSTIWTGVPNAISGIHIYSIGLGNFGGVPADFLERVANDPRASNYDSTKPAGLYIFAATSADLTDAFNTIASQILHLSK
jgi:Flp pilus assembly protein TadG